MCNNIRIEFHFAEDAQSNRVCISLLWCDRTVLRSSEYRVTRQYLLYLSNLRWFMEMLQWTGCLDKLNWWFASRSRILFANNANNSRQHQIERFDGGIEMAEKRIERKVLRFRLELCECEHMLALMFTRSLRQIIPSCQMPIRSVFLPSTNAAGSVNRMHAIEEKKQWWNCNKVMFNSLLQSFASLASPSNNGYG